MSAECWEKSFIFSKSYTIYSLKEHETEWEADKWDCVVRNHADRPDLVHAYLQFLHSLFKSEEAKKFLALAYITGILPIKKIKDESALNNFIEYTMLESNELTPYFGFSQKEVEELVELAHSSYTPLLKYNDENALSCVLTMAYFTAPAYYNVIREFPSGVGFADMVLIPRADAGERPAIIIELKWDKNADSSIKQIKECRYTGNLKGYGKKILLVGITYDKKSENKKHECVIEE